MFVFRLCHSQQELIIWYSRFLGRRRENKQYANAGDGSLSSWLWLLIILLACFGISLFQTLTRYYTSCIFPFPFQCMRNLLYALYNKRSHFLIYTPGCILNGFVRIDLGQKYVSVSRTVWTHRELVLMSVTHKGLVRRQGEGMERQ